MSPHERVDGVKQETAHVLAMNVGSSSIRFSVYATGRPPQRQLHGKIDRVGSIGTTLVFDDPVRHPRASIRTD